MKSAIISVLIILIITILMIMFAPMSMTEQEKYKKEMFLRLMIENAPKHILSDSKRFNKIVDNLYVKYKNNVAEAIEIIKKL